MPTFNLWEFINGVGLPWQDGVVTLVIFFAIAVLVTWRNERLPVGPFAQLMIALGLFRYSQSYIIFHQTLREGIWPLLWSLGVVCGVWVTSKRPK